MYWESLCLFLHRLILFVELPRFIILFLPSYEILPRDLLNLLNSVFLKSVSIWVLCLLPFLSFINSYHTMVIVTQAAFHHDRS